MTLTEIFSKSYLFDPKPDYHSNLYIPLTIIFSVMIVFAILFKLLGKKIAFNVEGFFQPFIWGGFLGFFYMFSRFEGLPWLGSRFFLILVLSISLLWFLIAAVISAIKLPKLTREKTAEERYQKYLPKKKS